MKNDFKSKFGQKTKFSKSKFVQKIEEITEKLVFKIGAKINDF